MPSLAVPLKVRLRIIRRKRFMPRLSSMRVATAWTGIVATMLMLGGGLLIAR